MGVHPVAWFIAKVWRGAGYDIDFVPVAFREQSRAVGVAFEHDNARRVYDVVAMQGIACRTVRGIESIPHLADVQVEVQRGCPAKRLLLCAGSIDDTTAGTRRRGEVQNTCPHCACVCGGGFECSLRGDYDVARLSVCVCRSRNFIPRQNQVLPAARKLDGIPESLTGLAHSFGVSERLGVFLSSRHHGSSMSSISHPSARESRSTDSASARFMFFLRCSYIWIERRPTPDIFASRDCEQP